MKRILMTIVTAIIAVPMVFSFSCKADDPVPMETITIGSTPIELNALIYVAEEQGYLAKNSVRVTFKDYATGAAAVEGLLKNEVDLGMTFESVIVGKVLQKQNIQVLTTIDKSNLFYVVARADRGINTVKDLKAKKIGVPKNTIMEFYLGRLLDLNGMNIRDVTMVDMSPTDAETKIAAGDLDALIVFEPHVTQIERKMGDAVVIWPAQSNQMSYWNMVGNASWVDDHPGLVSRFIKSLAQAENYVNLQAAKTKNILKARFKYDDAYIDALWKENQFSLSLDQSLITAMEDEARWMMENNLTTEKQVPNFPEYINEHALKEIKPGAVTIVK